MILYDKFRQHCQLVALVPLERLCSKRRPWSGASRCTPRTSVQCPRPLLTRSHDIPLVQVVIQGLRLAFSVYLVRVSTGWISPSLTTQNLVTGYGQSTALSSGKVHIISKCAVLFCSLRRRLRCVVSASVSGEFSSQNRNIQATGIDLQVDYLALYSMPPSQRVLRPRKQRPDAPAKASIYSSFRLSHRLIRGRFCLRPEAERSASDQNVMRGRA